MTNSEIEAFLAVIQVGNISKAAETLFITQPALSRRIKTLEDELGYSLFHRQKGMRSIELTDAGKQFIEIAEGWENLWKATQRIKNRVQTPILRVSAQDSFGTYIFPPIYEAFTKRRPDVSLHIRSLNSYPAYDQMEGGILDLAFTMDKRYSKTVVTTKAFSEPMYFICSAKADYPEKVHPSMLKVEEEVYISWNKEYDRWHRAWFENAGKPLIVSEKMSLMEYFVSKGQNWAIVPASVVAGVGARGAIVTRELLDPPPDRVCNYITVPGRREELVETFLDCFKEHLKNDHISHAKLEF